MKTKQEPNEQDVLRNRPTVDLWRDEIHRLLSGQRESDLREIGVHEYIAGILHDSPKSSNPKPAFERALQDIASSWNPDEDPGSIETFLEIVAAYRPRHGFEKILGYLVQWGAFPKTGPQASADDVYRVNLKALVALQAYYTVAPPLDPEDSAFISYTQLLWKLTDSSVYQAHALRRLLELGAVKVESPIVARLVRIPQVLSEVLQYTVGIRKEILQNYTGYLLAHCLTAQPAEEADRLYNIFKSILVQFQAKLVHEEQRSVILLANGGKIDLFIPGIAQAKYMEWRSRDISEAGSIEARRIASAVGI